MRGITVSDRLIKEKLCVGKKRQNKITEKRNIQKEIRRIPLFFLVLLSVMCTGSLTGCRAGNPQGQTELVPLNRNDTDSGKTRHRC